MGGGRRLTVAGPPGTRSAQCQNQRGPQAIAADRGRQHPERRAGRDLREIDQLDPVDGLLDTLDLFPGSQIAADLIDIDNDFPADMWRKFGDMGLLGITVEEEYGGSGMGYLAHSVALEEISRASASVGLSYGAHSNLCTNQIRRKGNLESARKSIPPPRSTCWALKVHFKVRRTVFWGLGSTTMQHACGCSENSASCS